MEPAGPSLNPKLAATAALNPVQGRAGDIRPGPLPGGSDAPSQLPVREARPHLRAGQLKGTATPRRIEGDRWGRGGAQLHRVLERRWGGGAAEREAVVGPRRRRWNGAQAQTGHGGERGPIGAGGMGSDPAPRRP